MDCLLCGGAVIYQGLVKQECVTETCPNFSPSLRETETEAPTDDYAGWEWDDQLGVWRKIETY